MSFLVRVGEAEDNDRKLAVVRKKYFHGILEYNQQSQRERREQAVLDRQRANLRINELNQYALDRLQVEEAALRQEKAAQQEVLREEYERQIKHRRERVLQERDTDRKYLHLQLAETERASQRRVADLMRIYDRTTVRSTLARARTDPDQDPQADNPQKPKRTPLLPAIERTHATSELKGRPRPQTPTNFNQTRRSLAALNPV